MKYFTRKSLLGAGASALALGAIALTSGQAQAQSATPDPTPTAEAADSTVVVVTARRKALQNATERKKNSDTMIDSIVADEAGKLPDNSVTEVLQRVVGVSITHSSLSDPNHFLVEGSGLQIRGLNGVASFVNRREVFSANGGTGLQWGEVTPELGASFDVYKANRADMIEGGTGGTIDMGTRMPFDYKKPEADITLGANYGDLAGKVSPTISGLVTRRFDTPVGEMGLLLDLAYSKLESGDNFIRTEPYASTYVPSLNKNVFIPSGFNFGNDFQTRERRGLYEAFQWRPNDNLTIWQYFFGSAYNSTSLGTESNIGGGKPEVDGVVLPVPGADAVYDSHGALLAGTVKRYGGSFGNNGSTIGQGWLSPEQQVSCNDSYGGMYHSTLNWSVFPPNCTVAPFKMTGQSIRGRAIQMGATVDASQGFTWNASEKLRVKGALQYVRSWAGQDLMNVGVGQSSPSLNGYSFDIRGDGVPHLAITDTSALANQSNYTWDWMGTIRPRNLGTMAAANIDLDYELSGGFFRTVRGGVRLADHWEHDNFHGSYWAPLANDWDGGNWTGGPNAYPNGNFHLDKVPADSELYVFKDFFRGEATALPDFWYPSEALMKGMDYNYFGATYGFDHGSETRPYSSEAERLFGDDPIQQVKTRVFNKALYIEGDFKSDEWHGIIPPFSGNLGMRGVQITLQSTGNLQQTYIPFYASQNDANADLEAHNGVATNFNYLIPTSTPVEAEFRYSRVLPSLNLNFKPTDKFFIRAAITRTMSPPGYGSANPSYRITLENAVGNTRNTGQSVDPVTHVVTPGKTYPVVGGNWTVQYGGNPHLKPTMSNNYDLAFEWYKSDSFNAHMSFFYKDLQDEIVQYDSRFNGSGEQVKANFFWHNAATGKDEIKEFSASTNQQVNWPGKANLKGVEMGLRKYLDNLPIKGFGVEANFTYLESYLPQPSGTDVLFHPFDRKFALPGLSRYNYNINLYYSRHDWDINLAYTWRSRYLENTAANGTTGDYRVFTESTYRLDWPERDNPVTGSPRQHFSLPTYADDYGTLDFGMSHKFTDHVRVSIQANNILDAKYKTVMELTPGWFVTRSYYISDRRVNFNLFLRY